MVMVCGETEMHSLPARMATELLTAEGWRVIHLGSAMPVAKLRYYLAEIDADLVGLSVSLATNLPGAARTVRAARQAGYSVICGGQAFDSSGTRARAIGATDNRATWPSRSCSTRCSGANRPRRMDADWARLESQRVEIVRDALSWLGTGDFADRVRSATWLAQFTADLDDLVAAGAAAMLCGDQTIVDEQRTWLEQRLTALGTPVEVVQNSFDALGAVVDKRVPGASELFA